MMLIFMMLFFVIALVAIFMFSFLAGMAGVIWSDTGGAGGWLVVLLICAAISVIIAFSVAVMI